MPSGRLAFCVSPRSRSLRGGTEAAVLHLRSLVARLRLANREFHQAERKLDELCATLRESTPRAGGAPPDATVLSSLPGVGTVTLATLLTEAAGPISAETMPRSGPSPAWRP